MRYQKHGPYEYELVKKISMRLGLKESTIWSYLSVGTLLGHRTPQDLYNDLDAVEAYARSRKQNRGRSLQHQKAFWDNPERIKEKISHHEDAISRLRRRLDELSSSK
mgnify:FL=1